MDMSQSQIKGTKCSHQCQQQQLIPTHFPHFSLISIFGHSFLLFSNSLLLCCIKNISKPYLRLLILMDVINSFLKKRIKSFILGLINKIISTKLT